MSLQLAMQSGIPPLSGEGFPMSFKYDGVHALKLKNKALDKTPYEDIKSIEVYKGKVEIIPRLRNSDTKDSYPSQTFELTEDDDRSVMFWYDLKQDLLRWAMQSGMIGFIEEQDGSRTPVYKQHIPDVNIHAELPTRFKKEALVRNNNNLTNVGRLYASHEELAIQEKNKKQ